MYNEERKMRFLTEMRSSVDFGRSVFNTIEPYEQKEEKDLCELTVDILQPIANAKFGSRTRTTDSTIAFLRSYVGWCKEQGYPTCSDVYELKTEMDEKMKRMMIASPIHLEAILNKIFEPVASETVDCLYRCYLWMGFAGIEEAEAIEVTVDEIDFDTMTIEHGGKSYEIYREAVPAFKMACNATEFRYVNPNYTDGKQGGYRNRYPGEHLLRGIRSAQIKLTTIRAVIGKKFKAEGIETSYGKIRLSGLFYKTYEMERFGEPINFDVFIIERMGKTDHQYHRNYTRNKLANGIRRDLEDDYECWKAAFTR